LSGIFSERHYIVEKCNADYYTCILLFLVLLDFSLWLVNGGMLCILCSSRHTLAPIDSIFGGPIPSNLYLPGVRSVVAHSFSQSGGPTPSSLPKSAHSDPRRRGGL